MNRGVMMKAAREVWGTTLLLGVLLFAVEGVLAFVLPTFASHFAAQMTQFKFFQNIIQAMIGADIGQTIGPEVFLAIAWVHPVVLSLVWAHAVVTATRVPAGEVDRGTIDVLLGLPVSRWGVYASETVVWAGSGTLILLAAVAGNALGSSRVTQAAHPDFGRVAIVVVNLWVMYLTVGSGASLLSALSSRRGKAMTASFVIVLGSFLVNYLAQLWEPAKRLAFLSVLEYHRPVNVLRDGGWPLRDMAVLGAVAAVLWIAGGLVFARRDLTTT
jgi:ABC-2 type transport system permease protein